jgi:hypothetical protein
MPPKHFGLDRDAMGMGELGGLLGGMALPKGRSKGRISLCELFDLMQGMFRIAGCVACGERFVASVHSNDLLFP